MKVFIAIHVSFCNSHVDGWTGCLAVFLEEIKKKKRGIVGEILCEYICRSMHSSNFIGR